MEVLQKILEVLQQMLQTLMLAEGKVLLFIQDYLRFPIVDDVMLFITKLGDKGIIWIVLGVIFLIPRKTRRAAILSLVALACAHLLCNEVLKEYVARIRPYEVVEGLSILIAKPSDYSFPSGHAMCSFAAAIVYFRHQPRRLGVPMLVLAILIAASRLYIGVHYPSDVIIGAFLGTIIAVVFILIFGKRNKKMKKRRL